VSPNIFTACSIGSAAYAGFLMSIRVTIGDAIVIGIALGLSIFCAYAARRMDE